MASLGEAYPVEQARCRELLQVYRDLPNGVGMFGAVTIEDVLRRADVAASSGDVVAMLRSWGEMKECK